MSTFNFVETIKENLSQPFAADIEVGFFSNISIYNSGKKSAYFRCYLKIQNLLENIGGIYDSLIMIAHFIDLYLAKSFYLIDLANVILFFW